MDDVIFSRVLLNSDYETFINLTKTCKKIRKVAKIIWKDWLTKNLIKEECNIYYKTKRKPIGFCKYTFFYAKGKKIRHGEFEYKLDDDVTGIRINCVSFNIPCLAGLNIKKAILNYSFDKLNGKCLFYKDHRLKIRTYKNNILHGPALSMSMIEEENIIQQVIYYNKSKKCCLWDSQGRGRSPCEKHKEEINKILTEYQKNDLKIKIY